MCFYYDDQPAMAETRLVKCRKDHQGGFAVRIVEASLCLRFYRSSGWTRDAVRELLIDDKRLARVMPRYFDARDNVGQGSNELDDGLPHDECEYFAVYGACEPFSRAELAKHEVIPFSG